MAGGFTQLFDGIEAGRTSRNAVREGVQKYVPANDDEKRVAFASAAAGFCAATVIVSIFAALIAKGAASGGGGGVGDAVAQDHKKWEDVFMRDDVAPTRDTTR